MLDVQKDDSTALLLILGKTKEEPQRESSLPHVATISRGKMSVSRELVVDVEHAFTISRAYCFPQNGGQH